MAKITFKHCIDEINVLYSTMFDAEDNVKDYKDFFKSEKQQNSVYESLQSIIKDLDKFMYQNDEKEYSDIKFDKSDKEKVFIRITSIKDALEYPLKKVEGPYNPFKEEKLITLNRYINRIREQIDYIVVLIPTKGYEEARKKERRKIKREQREQEQEQREQEEQEQREQREQEEREQEEEYPPTGGKRTRRKKIKSKKRNKKRNTKKTRKYRK